MHAPPATLQLRDLVVGYRGRALLPPISAALYPGQLWALIGRNGSGKSTVLHTALGLLPPVSGEVAWARTARRSVVAQREDADSAVPARVIDVVRGGLDRGWSFLDPTYAWRHRERALEALAATSSEALDKQRFSELSEGQRQRVRLARALASDANVLVLDEPTSALDHVAERDTFGLIARLCRDRGISALVASHHLGHIQAHASHALWVDRVRGAVMAGTLAEVMASEAFQRDGRPSRSTR